MWINHRVWEATQVQIAQAAVSLGQALAREDVLKQQNKAWQVNLDWMRTRVNQLEHERAQILFNYTGVKVAVPEVTKASPDFHGSPLTEAFCFSDMGDKEAERQGIKWDSEGNLVYDNK